MPKEPPSRHPDRKATIAYAFYAAAIWGLVAYSLWGPKPRPEHPFVLARTCAR